MKSKIFLFLHCIICVVLLPNCNKDRCNQNERANLSLTQEDRSIIPYTGTESLVFKNSKGDSIIFADGIKKIGFNTEYEYTRHEAEAYNGCQGDYFTTETDETGFQTSVDKGFLRIILSNNYTFAHPISKIYIEFAILPSDTIAVSFDGVFRFSKDTLFNFPNYPDSIIAFHKQISLGPKTFFDVYELYTYYTTHPDSIEWYNTAFYSIKEGLVGLRTNYGKLLYLDRKR